MTIRKKMILILLASTIIPLCLVGTLGYFHARRTLEAVRMEKLKSIADLKVKRIEDLEKIVEDQNKTISVLNRNLDKLTETMTLLVAQVAALPEPKPGKDGQDGKQGPPGQDGVDNRPIDLILEFVDDTGKVVATDQKTYPRGTPLVLRFSEKLLKE